MSESDFKEIASTFKQSRKREEEREKNPFYEISLVLTADEMIELMKFLKKLRNS